MFFFFLFKQSYGKIISSSSRIIGDIVYTMKVAIKYGPQEVEAEEAPAEEAPVEEAPAETQE
jgi:hypothetical protein